MYPLQLRNGAECGEGARGKGVFPIALCTPAHLCQNASLLAGGLLSPNKTGVKAFVRQNKSEKKIYFCRRGRHTDSLS